MATDLYAITNATPLSRFDKEAITAVFVKLNALEWKPFRYPKTVEGIERWVDATGTWRVEDEVDDGEDHTPEMHFESPYIMSFCVKEHIGIVPFIYKYRHLYDMATHPDYIQDFRKQLYDLISIFGGTEVCFLADNACHVLSSLLELEAYENTSYSDIKQTLIKELGNPVTDYATLKREHLNYKNITEFVFDDFASFKNG